MNNSIKSMFLKTSVFSLVIFLLGDALFTTFLKNYYLNIFLVIFLYFIILTISVNVVLIKISKHKISSFVNKFMIASTLKMFLNLICLVVYVMIQRQNAVPFLICFLIHYMLFTTYEVVSILSFLKKD